MMDLLSGLTDDQIALMGCVGLLLAAGTLMSLSYHLGCFVRRHVGQHAPRVLPSSGQPDAGDDRAHDRAA